MLKRWWIPAALLLLVFVPFLSCKKSEGNKITNFFGAPPQVSEVTVTKERGNFNCEIISGICDQDCSPATGTPYALGIDLVTATAKVVDPTPPTTGTTDILVVVVRFLDPPPSVVPPGTQISQISLEMFDTGAVQLATVDTAEDPPRTVPVYSGDLIANDGIYTRKFYFGTSTTSVAPCAEIDNLDNLGHTFSTYSTSRDVSPSTSIPYAFTVQAIDNSGNITNSTEFPVPIQGTSRDQGAPIPGIPCGTPHCVGSSCLKLCSFTCRADRNGYCCGCNPPGQ